MTERSVLILSAALILAAILMRPTYSVSTGGGSLTSAYVVNTWTGAAWTCHITGCRPLASE